MERTELLIVASPRHAKLQAFVFIRDSESMADRREPVRLRGRILVRVRKVEDGRAEYRPITCDEDARRETQFFLVAKVLDRRIDVPIQLEITDLRVGLLTANSEVHLVPPHRKIVLIEAETVGYVDQPAEAYPRSADDI